MHYCDNFYRMCLREWKLIPSDYGYIITTTAAAYKYYCVFQYSYKLTCMRNKSTATNHKL